MNKGLKSLWAENPLVRAAAISALVAALAFSAFSDAFDAEFIATDDPSYVLSNPHVTEGLTGESLPWAFSTLHTGNWHPLTWLSHMLDVELYGLNPRGHHLTSLLFHSANAVLCFILFRLLTGSMWQGAVIAILFAIHPLRAESVAWVSERKDVLTAFFGLLSLIAYARYAVTAGIRHYLGALVFLLLGLLSKSMLVTWPFLFLLLDYWPFNRFGPELKVPAPGTRRPFAKLVIEKWPFFALAAVFCAVIYYAQANQGAVSRLEVLPLSMRLQNTGISYIRYLGKIFVPTSLAVFYPLSFDESTKWKFLAALAILIALTMAVLKLRTRFPCLLTGWFWFLGTLVPVIGLVQIGSQSMADRYTYLPGLGILLMLVPPASDLLKKRPKLKLAAGALVTLVTLVLLALSWVQTSYWKNSLTLYAHAIEVTETNPLISLTYAAELEQINRFDLALEEYQKVRDEYPDSLQPYLGIANLYLSTGQPKKAEPVLNEAYARFGDASPELLAQLARLYMETGRPEKAQQFFDKATRAAEQEGKADLLDALKHMQRLLNNQPPPGSPADQ